MINSNLPKKLINNFRCNIAKLVACSVAFFFVLSLGESYCRSAVRIMQLGQAVALHPLCHTFATNLVNGIKQPDGTIKSLTPRQVGDLLGHSTSQITEMYYVKRDTSRLIGITDSFEFGLNISID